MHAIVIEDQAAIRALLAELLRSEGFAVQTFSDASAWEKSTEPPADLYIVDWHLPEGTAESVLKRLMPESSKASCLIVSGCTINLDCFPVEWRTRMAFLEKPFTAAMFRQLVSALMAAAARNR
jgi:DNA-binding response OmpR family regulator